jgi:Leucine-rich repeat (LRR) protein
MSIFSLINTSLTTKFQFTYSGLTGVIDSSSLGPLTGLTSLDLSHNHVTGPPPNVSLPLLLQLDLSGNELSGKIPNYNSLTPLISYLNFSGNSITDIGYQDNVLLYKKLGSNVDLGKNAVGQICVQLPGGSNVANVDCTHYWCDSNSCAYIEDPTHILQYIEVNFLGIFSEFSGESYFL